MPRLLRCQGLAVENLRLRPWTPWIWGILDFCNNRVTPDGTNPHQVFYRTGDIPRSQKAAAMANAVFRFYEELNDFLPRHRRKKDFEAEFKGKRSVKDMVEALGVPHAQIDLILANGKSVGFNYILQDGDRLSVYPVFECFNIKNISRLREVPLRKTRFIADKTVNGIVKCMRLLGFDVYCDAALPDEKIIEISNREKRIILTKSRKLLKSGDVTRGILIGPGTTDRQVKKIIEYLNITEQANSSCRGALKT